MKTIKITEFEGIVASVHLSKFDSFVGLSDDYKELTTSNDSKLAAIANIVANEVSENVNVSGILALENNRKVKALKRISKKLLK